MSKMWPLDDVRNERWLEFEEYLDDLLVELGDNEKSLLLTSICGYENVPHLVERLIDFGADPSFDSYHSGCDKLAIIRLFDGDVGVTPIGSAVMGFFHFRRSTFDNLRVLLSKGANVNQAALSTYTPLQLSIVHDLPEFVRFFLENGADPCVPSTEFDGPNAWDYAEGKEWALLLLKEFDCGKDS
ncbi:ankyrin repeat protein [Hydrogenophaga palleronii]|uniref:Ankyrin repeat protein n=1 Tax=Hydrogenophaga palleronii TaxID=65655 RepID=A0ABU1WTX2_9BURK|nr:hypothetical protein [Hydrogenophaga palleronii]MDR7152749.1 ankyrin repeat protein [Hydrogenophaga palleronii]